jgi:hypothetical protein
MSIPALALAAVATSGAAPTGARAGAPGTAAAAAADGAPATMVAYFAGDACPAGWQPADDARGRLIVGVLAPADVGVTVGTPLGDQEDRAHEHAWLATLSVPAKNISAADGGNQQGARAQSYDVGGMTGPATTGLPFAQLLVCEKP